MRVWVVLGGWHYEGFEVESIHATEQGAYACVEAIRRNHMRGARGVRYDDVRVEKHDVVLAAHDKGEAP